MRIEELEVYTYDEDRAGFFLRRDVQLLCPACGARLKRYGRRKRHLKLSSGAQKCITVQRMLCTGTNCQKVHHILPAGILPYRRYTACCLECVLDGNAERIACEESTARAWHRWFGKVQMQLDEAVRQAYEHGWSLYRSLTGLKKLRPAGWLRYAAVCLIQYGVGTATRTA